MRRTIVSMAVTAMLAVPVCAQMRTQTITLTKGWNAVWLEVQPENSSLVDTFEGVPVDLVAGYIQPLSEAQFVKNTTVNMQALAGWNVWYAPYRADAPLSRLQQLNANTGYLMYAQDAATLTVRGTVPSDKVRWTPNRFNLVGFSVAAQGAPTFREFFQGSPAHNHNKIYRLQGGMWRQVLSPEAAALSPGEAFWIYCEGASDYQGPLSVKANSPLGLVLNGSLKGVVEIGNATTHPLAFTMEQVIQEGNADLPLAAVISTVTDGSTKLLDVPIDFPAGAWTQAFPEFDGGKGMSLPFVLRVKEMRPGSYTGLLKLTTDLGSETWLPVRAER